MTDAVKIEIKTRPRFKPVRILVTLSLIVGVIGIGILAESFAMQWAGFVFLCIMMVVAAGMFHAQNTGLTIEQARARLDAIEKEEIK